MSVSFSTQGGIQWVACTSEGCCDADRCGYCYDGMGTNVLNLSNANARLMLNILGENEIDGRWNVDECLKALNSIERITAQDMAPFASETVMSRGKTRVVVNPENNLPTIQGGCRVIDMGQTEDDLLYRFKRLGKLLQAAIDSNSSVVWG